MAGWRGLIFERCSNCDRPTLNARSENWCYYADSDGIVFGFCPSCAASEFGSVPSDPSCPACDGDLLQQPRGGWVCDDHGLTVIPKVVFG